MGMRTETIEYNADGLHMVSHLYYDETKQGRRPGVLVFPEAFGLGIDRAHRVYCAMSAGNLPHPVQDAADGEIGGKLNTARCG
jgi:hypothetical protein